MAELSKKSKSGGDPMFKKPVYQYKNKGEMDSSAALIMLESVIDRIKEAKVKRVQISIDVKAFA